MTPRPWVLRSDDLYWSRHGWTDCRESAERFETIERARATRADIDTDRDCVVVRWVGVGARTS